MPDKVSNLEFAARVVERQFAEAQARYDTLTHKLGLYLSALAILTALLVMFLQSLLAENGSVRPLIDKIETAPPFSVTLLVFLAVGLLTTVVCLVMAVIRVVQAITPITLQQIDDEAVSTALAQKIEAALEVYVRDMTSATKANQEAIRDRFSLLFSIKRWLVTFLIAYAIVLVDLALVLLFA